MWAWPSSVSLAHGATEQYYEIEHVSMSAFSLVTSSLWRLVPPLPRRHVHRGGMVVQAEETGTNVMDTPIPPVLSAPADLDLSTLLRRSNSCTAARQRLPTYARQCALRHRGRIRGRQRAPTRPRVRATRQRPRRGLNRRRHVARAGLYPARRVRPPDTPARVSESWRYWPWCRALFHRRPCHGLVGGGPAELVIVHERAALPMPDTLTFWKRAGSGGIHGRT